MKLVSLVSTLNYMKFSGLQDVVKCVYTIVTIVRSSQSAVHSPQFVNGKCHFAFEYMFAGAVGLIAPRRRTVFVEIT